MINNLVFIYMLQILYFKSLNFFFSIYELYINLYINEIYFLIGICFNILIFFKLYSIFFLFLFEQLYLKLNFTVFLYLLTFYIYINFIIFNHLITIINFVFILKIFFIQFILSNFILLNNNNVTNLLFTISNINNILIFSILIYTKTNIFFVYTLYQTIYTISIYFFTLFYYYFFAYNFFNVKNTKLNLIYKINMISFYTDFITNLNFIFYLINFGGLPVNINFVLKIILISILISKNSISLYILAIFSVLVLYIIYFKLFYKFFFVNINKNNTILVKILLFRMFITGNTYFFFLISFDFLYIFDILQ